MLLASPPSPPPSPFPSLSQDLCDRRERTVQRKHQKALAKVQTMVTYKEHMESQRKHMVRGPVWWWGFKRVGL